MRSACRWSAVVLLVASAADPAAAAADPAGEAGRSLLEVVGIVSEIGVSREVDGSAWLDASVATETRGTVRIRLAPPEVLERERFVLSTGDRVSARVFGDEVPHGVHRITNVTTGSSLRLRCLHGDPLWNGAAVQQGHRRWRGGR